MNKKIVLPLIAVIILLIGGVAYLFYSLNQQKAANKEMQELAALDKQEMENEYVQVARQYSEMKHQINNDSIVAQLTQEQLRTQQLLEELKRVKSTDAREIARLKKELATVRAVLRSYVLQIDSLNQVNQSLTEENSRIKGEYAMAAQQIEGLNSEKASLSEKVAIAAQLDATNINLSMKKKSGKVAKKLKDCKMMAVTFTVTKNVTATNGLRTFYVRITKPNGETMGSGASFSYESKTITYTMRKDVEYSGEELNISTFYNVTEYLTAGNYLVSIFADGSMIGSRQFSLK